MHLPQRREVGLHAEVRPAAAARQPEAGADLVEDQQRAVLVAKLARRGRERLLGQRLVLEGLVPERRGDDAGDVALVGLERRLQAVGVVVLVVDEVRLVLRQGAGRARRAPGRGAVVGAGGAEDLAALGLGARGDDRHRGGVRAVLAEDRPVGVVDHADQRLGQHDDDFGRAGHRIAQRLLRGRGGLHRLEPVAQQVRPVGAHEVDVLVAVDVPEPRAARPAEELRVLLRQHAGRLVPEHAARDDLAGPLLQVLVLHIGPGHRVHHITARAARTAPILRSRAAGAGATPPPAFSRSRAASAARAARPSPWRRSPSA